MLDHKAQTYQRLWLSRSRFRAMEIFKRAMAAVAEMIDCQKPTFENMTISAGRIVS